MVAVGRLSRRIAQCRLNRDQPGGRVRAQTQVVCNLQVLQGECEGRGAARRVRLTLGYSRGQLEEEILHSIVKLQRYLAVAFGPGPSAVVLWACARAAKCTAGSPL